MNPTDLMTFSHDIIIGIHCILLAYFMKKKKKKKQD